MPVNIAGLSLETRTRLLAGLAEAGKQGIRYNVTSGHRSAQKGRDLWADRANNPFPVAPPGASLHERGDAVDIVLADEKQRAKFTAIMEKQGLSWGGNFNRPDPIHYEYRPGGVRRKKQRASDDLSALVPPAKGAARPDDLSALVPPVTRVANARPDDLSALVSPPPRAARPDDLSALVPPAKPKPPTPRAAPANWFEGLVRRIEGVAEPTATAIGQRLRPKVAAIEQGMRADVAATSSAAQAAPGEVVRALAPDQPVGQLLVRLNAVSYPLNNVINSVLRESARRRKRKGGRLTFSEGVESDVQGLLNSHPWQQFKEALIDAVPGENLAVARIGYHSRPEVKALFDKLHINPAVVDFLLEIPVSSVGGRAQHAATRLLDRAVAPIGRAAVKGAVTAGRAAAARPKQNFATRAVEALGAEIEGRPFYRGSMETMNRAAARNEAVAREAADVTEETRRTSQEYLRQGVKVRVTEPVTGRTVNRFDQFIADWLEAGSAGSRHEALSGGGVQVGRRRLKQVLAASTKAVPKRVQALRSAERAEVDTARAAAEAADAYRTLRGPQPTAPRFAGQVAKGSRTLKLSGGALGESRKIEQNIIAQARVAGEELQTAQRQQARLTTRARDQRGRAQRLVIAAKPRRDALQQARGQLPALRESREAAVQAHRSARRALDELESQARRQPRTLNPAAKAAEEQLKALERNHAASVAAHRAARRKADTLGKQARSYRKDPAERTAARQIADRARANEERLGRQTLVTQRELERGRAAARKAAQPIADTEAARAARAVALRARRNEDRLQREMVQRTRELAEAEGRVRTLSARTSANQALDVADQRALSAEAAVETQAQKITGLQKTRTEVAGQLAKARTNTEQTRVRIEAARQRAIATGKAAKKAKDARIRAATRFDTAVERQSAAHAVKSLPVTKAAQRLRRGVEHKAIRAEAEALGVRWEDVERIGKRWQKISDAQGKRLVELGLLDADTFARLRGVYLPRLYLLRSTNPRAAEELLRSLERAGKIGPEEARAVRQWLLKKTERGADDITPRTFDEVRELETFIDRDMPGLGRLVEGSATPAMAGYAQKTSRAIADAEGIAEIVSNPKFAMKKELSQAGSSAPEGWVKEVVSNGETYLLHPAVAKYLAYRNNPSAMQKLMDRFPAYRKVNTVIRRLWVGTTRTAANNGVGNYWLGHSAAAIEGAPGYTPAAYARSVKAVKEWRKDRKLADPHLREAVEQTDLMSEGGTLLPREAQRVGSGFGVETRAQQAAQLPGRAAEGFTNLAFRDIEQAGRLTLYASLRRGGKSIDEAARITRSVMIDYSDVGPLRRLLEESNALPFVTFPTKAVFQLLNQGYRRPDLLNTWSGERLRSHIDQAADEEARRQGKTPVARERRATGQYGMFDFPLPGRYDELERPEVLRSPLLAPAATLFGMTPGGDVSDVVEERLSSALPLPMTLINTFRNKEYNPFRKEYQNIVEPGSIPPTGPFGGRDQEALARGASFFRTLIPQVRDLERIWQAGQGVSRYGAKPQDLADAFAQSFLGVRVDSRIGETARDRKARKGREAAQPKADSGADEALRQHWDWLSRSSRANPNFVPDATMKAKADSYQDAATVAAHLKAAKAELKIAKEGARYTGEDRVKAVKNSATWIYTLQARAQELARRDALQSQPGEIPQPLLEYFQRQQQATQSPRSGASPP